MPPLPPTWLQRHRHGKQHPCLILLFTAHLGMGDEKQPLFTPGLALSDHHVPGFLGLGLIHFSSTPLSYVLTRPRPPSVEQRNNVCMSTTGNRTSTTAPRMSHRPVINVTTTPQGWPAFTDARRYSNLHSAHRAFTPKAPP
jgi:hypothetical protein